jgi:hypothetical protein
MQATEQQLTIALKQRVQGFNYTQLELVNWMCTEFGITLILSEKVVAELGVRK